ncbi:NAD(P)-dependent oxidoreductase [Glaciecola sp. MF2-115]|uniref:NAD(P)-dependent oxidoreductase n=1 Tax=Glaciecola sp. MF2-115 TaxID=3384827 RepID=UPI0039A1B48F
MSKALIGYTGFVGSNLLKQQQFDDCYNSSNIHQIAGKEYEQIICAGVSAVKWMANREPEKDRENIQSLMAHLKQVKADKFILISTVDVYPVPINVDEKTEVHLDECQPYGKHRLELEYFVKNDFDSVVIRLPGLFGTGLKKNIIYDFLNDNDVDKINPNGSFQFYNLDHLTKDINIALKNSLTTLNISCEPIGVQEVAEVCLGHKLAKSASSGVSYDYKSLYATLFGGSHGYLYNKQEVIADLVAYKQEYMATSEKG